MDVLLAPFALIGLLLFSPFIALNAYVFVWICGPAIRRAGRCWQEGANRAMDEWEAHRFGAGDKIHGRIVGSDVVLSAPAPAIPKQTAPEIPIPDSGHRWLGSPTGSKR
jgi:hypothetical protein